MAIDALNRNKRPLCIKTCRIEKEVNGVVCDSVLSLGRGEENIKRVDFKMCRRVEKTR